ncbi:MAG: hypothetical protein JSR97_00615 [Verrucomicrobia bacterium]|nr:hypothetical protein [Verrucomicrobiota bacterium]
MSFASQISANFGYHNYTSYSYSVSMKIYDDKDNDPATFNGLNILGYLPIISVFIALARIVAVQESTTITNYTITKIMTYVRAFFEFFCAGIIFLPFDILTTVGRFTCQQNTNYQQLESD